MIAPPPYLTLEIRSEDGSRTEFFQDEEASVHTTLHRLTGLRLFAQPLLLLASQDNVSMIPSRTIDMLFARTSVSMPMQWPGGLADIVEVSGGDTPLAQYAQSTDSERAANTTAMRLQIHTVGGWEITLDLMPVAQLTVPDRRVLLAHFFELPVIAFRLAAEGIGLLNPSQIIRVTGEPSAKSEHFSKWPGLNAVPNAVLPVRFSRWSPGFRDHQSNTFNAYSGPKPELQEATI